MSERNNPANGCVIQICANGPMLVEGAAELQGKPIEPGTALCRCGHSNNKPFCDGSHRTQGFADPGRLGKTVVPGSPVEPTPLRIKLSPKGPVLCAGSVTVRAADGSETVSGARMSLCRCGGSSNKPFCDGTHARIGFDADGVIQPDLPKN